MSGVEATWPLPWTRMRGGLGFMFEDSLKGELLRCHSIIQAVPSCFGQETAFWMRTFAGPFWQRPVW